MRGLLTAIVMSLLGLNSGLGFAGEWSTYHGDYALTGVAADAFPEKPQRLWRTKVGMGLSSPVVGGGGRVFFIADETAVMSLDTKGDRLWSQTFQTTNRVGEIEDETFVAPPLYVGHGLLVVASEDGNVYGLSPVNGTPQWRYASAGRIQGTPNYVVSGKKRQPGTVLVITQDGGEVHAVSAADGRGLWISEPGERTDGHMAVADGYAMFGNCASTLVAVDVIAGKDGASVSVGEGCEMAGGLAASGGRVYGGNRSGSFACVDLKPPALRWVNADGEGSVFTTPAVGRDRVVFSSGDGVLYGVDPESGKSRWSFDTGGMDPLSPIIAGDGVVAAIDGTLYGLALKDGGLRWTLAISDEITSPSIIDGMIVVGTDDGYVAAYGIQDPTASGVSP
jgi:outer membrane protein assembly factor BamB